MSGRTSPKRQPVAVGVIQTAMDVTNFLRSNGSAFTLVNRYAFNELQEQLNDCLARCPPDDASAPAPPPPVRQRSTSASRRLAGMHRGDVSAFMAARRETRFLPWNHRLSTAGSHRRSVVEETYVPSSSSSSSKRRGGRAAASGAHARVRQPSSTSGGGGHARVRQHSSTRQ